jgi:hypothetical protein
MTIFYGFIMITNTNLNFRRKGKYNIKISLFHNNDSQIIKVSLSKVICY